MLNYQRVFQALSRHVGSLMSAAQWRWAHCDHRGGRCWNQPSLAWLNFSWAKSMKNMGKKIMDKILIWESHIFHFVKIGGWNSWFSWQWWGCYIYIWYGIKIRLLGWLTPNPQQNRDSFYTPPISGHWGWFIVLGLHCQTWWVQLWGGTYWWHMLGPPF